MKAQSSVLWLAGLILLCASASCNRAQKPAAPAVDETHVQQMLLSLPPDGEMRAELDQGQRGDGVSYSWMAHMKELGVRRAMLSTKFIWLLHPVYIRVPRIAYFSAYDTNCAQITDRELLGKIAKTGLENELKEFAIAKTAQSPWWTFEHIHRAFHGSATVDVVDDPWLPVSRTFLFPQRGRDRPPEIVVDGDLQQLNALLASRRFSQDELDGALTETSAWLDDECFIRRLIEAGANPNFRNPDAETPLMFAAEAGHVHAVQALLEAGADPAAKNSLGETALVLARRRQYQRIVSLLARKPGGPG